MFWRITETTDSVTLSTATANVETEVIDIQVPDTYRYLIPQITLFDLTLKTAGAVAAEDSAEITIYVARPDKRDKKFVGRFPYREVVHATPYDRNKAFYLKLIQALNLPERWHLLFNVKSTSAMASAQTLFQLDAQKVQV